MEGKAIETREAVRYLGVEFKRNLRVAEQVERMVRKAKSKRGVLCNVVHGTLLYVTEAWIDE